MTIKEKAIMYFKDLRKRFCEDYLICIPKNTVAYKATMVEKEFYDTAIEALEQTRWIPVSERLPEESLNSVIGWDAHRERCVFVQYIDGYFQITGSYESFNIVAWMPLPEPYKVESEDKDESLEV